jgi:hypothetical protein
MSRSPGATFWQPGAAPLDDGNIHCPSENAEEEQYCACVASHPMYM